MKRARPFYTWTSYRKHPAFNYDFESGKPTFPVPEEGNTSEYEIVIAEIMEIMDNIPRKPHPWIISIKRCFYFFLFYAI